MMGHPSSNARHAMEEAFCRDVDNMLIGRLQVHADSDEARQELADSAHLKDHKLIAQLARLGVTPRGLIAMQLAPSVLIAWADRGVDAKERALVVSQAKRFGIRERTEAHALLEHWLDHRPPVLLFDAWRRFMRHELASMSGKPKDRLISITKEQTHDIAHCSGGFLGIGRVSSNEQKLLLAINRVLDDGTADSAQRRELAS